MLMEVQTDLDVKDDPALGERNRRGEIRAASDQNDDFDDFNEEDFDDEFDDDFEEEEEDDFDSGNTEPDGDDDKNGDAGSRNSNG